GIPENIDVGGPKSKPTISKVVPFFLGGIVHGPSFIGYGRGNPKSKITVKGGAESNGLWKNSCGPRPAHTVQGFVPPTIGRNAQSFHSRGIVHHLVCLLFQGKSGNEVLDPLINGQ